MTTDAQAGLPEQLATYLAGRDQQRLNEAAARWEALTEREQLLVKEAAVLAFVHGTQLGLAHAASMAGGTPPIPSDRDIVVNLLTAVPTFADLYPTLATLGEPQ